MFLSLGSYNLSNNNLHNMELVRKLKLISEYNAFIKFIKLHLLKLKSLADQLSKMPDLYSIITFTADVFQICKATTVLLSYGFI